MSQLTALAERELANQLRAAGNLSERQRTANRRINRAKGLGIEIPPLLVEAVTRGGTFLGDPRVQSANDFLDDEIAKARGSQPLIPRTHDRDALFRQAFSPADEAVARAQLGRASQGRETLQRSIIEGERRRNIGEVPDERIARTKGRTDVEVARQGRIGTVGAAEAAAKAQAEVNAARLAEQEMIQKGETGRTQLQEQGQDERIGKQADADIRVFEAGAKQRLEEARTSPDPVVRAEARAGSNIRRLEGFGERLLQPAQGEAFIDTLNAVERDIAAMVADGDVDAARAVRGKLLETLDTEIKKFEQSPFSRAARIAASSTGLLPLLGIASKGRGDNRENAHREAVAARERLINLDL